jgi:hypothetical protein
MEVRILEVGIIFLGRDHRDRRIIARRDNIGKNKVARIRWGKN